MYYTYMVNAMNAIHIVQYMCIRTQYTRTPREYMHDIITCKENSSACSVFDGNTKASRICHVIKLAEEELCMLRDRYVETEENGEYDTRRRGERERRDDNDVIISKCNGTINYRFSLLRQTHWMRFTCDIAFRFAHSSCQGPFTATGTRNSRAPALGVG